MCILYMCYIYVCIYVSMGLKPGELAANWLRLSCLRVFTFPSQYFKGNKANLFQTDCRYF